MTNGMKPTPGAQRAVAQDVLHVQADAHRQAEHDATGQEDRGKCGQPVAVAEQLERDDGVFGGALHDGERDASRHGDYARTEGGK